MFPLFTGNVLLFDTYSLGFNLIILLVASVFYDGEVKPLAWVFGLTSFFVVITAFYAFLDDEISNAVAFPVIILNGAITIVIFAFLHSAEGIVFSGSGSLEIGGNKINEGGIVSEF